MAWTKLITMAVAALSACTGSAMADIQPWDASGGSLGGGGSGALDHHGGRGGFGPRGGGSSVVDNDTAGIQLLMFGSNGTIRSINAGGLISVERSRPPISIGQNRNGALQGGSRGTVLASWDEFISPTFNTIVVTIFSSDGQDLMPLGVVNPADPDETFDFWTWNFGVNDPVTWRNQMPAAPLISAEYKLSNNGGQSFYSSKSITNLSNPWPGEDPGTTQGEPGNGVNYLKISYKVGQVPMPGALALAGLCTLGAARRRRR